ncbi:M23 family metallopeptidase [Streptomyces boluensis]|uniref:Peptidoglycan DD-metalloendopeptidase family protein n=1 Tax=Streptomyces boluensis TaxID=1775135 RepID=A0A964US12_9ACTN|nr:peptidoglycan DD-metalloendopeptidase family protein [Streptomyces boluensis]NBE53371.1 peptidoglycan DD-metalloendopeptidase family protein [Streptomyces boluensis]
MNDQHGYAAGYDGYTTGAFDTTSFDADPLFGAMPGATDAYDAGQTGQWDNTQWSTGAPAGYDPYANGAAQQTAVHPNAQQDAGSYGTGSYDTTAMWATGGYQQLADIPAQPGPQAADQWDATGQWQAQGFDQPTGLEHGQAYLETGAYDATAWNVDGTTVPAPADPYDAYGTDGMTGTYGATAFDTPGFDTPGFDTPAFDNPAFDNPAFDTPAFDTPAYDAPAYDSMGFASTGFEQPLPSVDEQVPAEQVAAEQEFSPVEFSGTAEPDLPPFPGQVDPAGAADDVDVSFAPAGAAPRGRSRRRAPAKRSALLTVAVPSVCALGVAGIAAASVAGGLDDQGETKTQAAPDPTTVKPSTANNKLDTQLANLSADADDFADRASRTQERIDLKERQEAERKRKAAEAARKEAMRPKFALPVKQHGLSALYGQAGINWMSAHSGIDFPVSYGTPVLAATDGTVRTQWNPAYGNMAIVTAADGTETWYCHLSSTKIRSGSVQAGDTIAYSGNSGNSTGPHLHFEVRPGGGSAIDPLPWLRSHGLDPS